MSHMSTPADVSLSVPMLEEIDRLCLEFEKDWKSGRGPRIEEHLGEMQGPQRARLLRELLLLDLDYRSRSGQESTPDEYRRRFPEDRELVEDVFRHQATPAAGDGTTARAGVTAAEKQMAPAELGDYELLEVLGEGGMGVVYRARQRSAERIVALKVIRPDRLAAAGPERRQEAIKRFRIESQAAAALEHDQIVPVYEVGEIDGQPFFSMRFVKGQSLEKLLRDGPLDGGQAAALLEQIARAVHYAHTRKIVHRDIKPRNILLDTDDRPYVADFGLAKSLAAAQELTQTGEVLGTPQYMSPEQARGEAAGSASDIYSLGATLYEMLTGRPPFRAATPAETQRQVIDNEPVPPRRLNPAVPRDLETICLKCLEKAPSKRYATAEDLADELERCQQGRPILARPITRPARTWRWCKRNPAVALLSATAVFLLLLLPAVAGFGYLREAEQREIAEQRGQTAEEARIKAEVSEAAERAAKARAQAAEQEARQAKTQAEQREAAERAAKQRAQDAERETRRTLYVADMKRVEQYWEISNLGVVRRLLSRYLPKPGEEDLRSFEWYYWWRQCHQDLMNLKHEGEVQLVAMSLDGKLLASASVGGVVKVWDLAAGKIKHAFQVADRDFAALAFSLDGKTLAAAGAHGEVRMWDAASGNGTYRSPNPIGFGMDVRGCVGFDSDCTKFARSCNTSGIVILYERSGDPRHVSGVKGALEGLFLSPWEKTIVGNTTFRAKTRLLKSWSRADENVPPPREYGGPAFCVAFSHDDALLAVGGREGTVKLWDLSDLSAEPKALIGHEGIVWSVAFSPDRKTLASAGGDGKVVLWDVDTGTQKIAFQAHGSDVYALLFLPDGNTLLSAGADSSIKLWDASSGTLKATLKGHEGPVNCLARSPEGQRFASASADGSVRVWGVGSDERKTSLEIPSARPGEPSAMILGVAFSPDGQLLAAVVRNDPRSRLLPPMPAGLPAHEYTVETVVLWDWKRGKELANFYRGMPYYEAMLSPSFSPDGKLLALGNMAWELDLDSRDKHLTYGWCRDSRAYSDQNKMVGPAAFAPDHKTVATPGIMEGSVELWAIGPRGRPSGHQATLKGDAEYCLAVAFSPDCKTLAAAMDRSVQLWDVDGRKLKNVLRGHTDFVRSVVYSRDGKTLVSASSDGTVKLWDVDTGNVRVTLQGHKEGVSSVAISPDDKTVASAGRDAAVKLWDLAGGEEKATLRGHTGWVVSVAFSPDGRTLASGSADGTVRLWKGASDEELQRRMADDR